MLNGGACSLVRHEETSSFGEQEHEQAPRSVVRGRNKNYIVVIKSDKAGLNAYVIHVAQWLSFNGSNLKVVQRVTLYFV